MWKLLHASHAAGRLDQWERSLRLVDQCIERFADTAIPNGKRTPRSTWPSASSTRAILTGRPGTMNG